MGIISEVKCTRCDRRFSGFRARCPYCGARRNQRGKHADENDNSKSRLLITLILLIVVIAAVVVLIISSKNKAPDAVDDTPNLPDTVEDISSVPGTEPSASPSAPPYVAPSPSPSSSPSPSPEKKVESVRISFLGDEATDVTCSVGDVIDFDCDYYPDDLDVTPVWSSSDDDAMTVLQTGEITALASADVELTVTVGDKTATCLIRIY